MAGDLPETSKRFHEVSRVSGHEISVTPKVSMRFQSGTALLQACTRKTHATPEPTNPEFKQRCTLLHVERWRFNRHGNRSPFICKFSKKGNAS
jgi:hypothetical protein